MTMTTYERRGAIALMTLNNPEKMNALGGAMLADLTADFAAAEADSGVRAVLITGAGRGFCAGAQLGTATFSAGAEVGDWMRASINPLIERVRASRLPVVVAVNGPAAGAGVVRFWVCVACPVVPSPSRSSCEWSRSGNASQYRSVSER